MIQEDSCPICTSRTYTRKSQDQARWICGVCGVTFEPWALRDSQVRDAASRRLLEGIPELDTLPEKLHSPVLALASELGERAAIRLLAMRGRVIDAGGRDGFELIGPKALVPVRKEVVWQQS